MGVGFELHGEGGGETPPSAGLREAPEKEPEASDEASEGFFLQTLNPNKP